MEVADRKVRIQEPADQSPLGLPDEMPQAYPIVQAINQDEASKAAEEGMKKEEFEKGRKAKQTYVYTRTSF